MAWHITLSPQFGEMAALAITVAGDTITINGDDLDLSPLEDGDVLDREAVDSPFLVDDVRKLVATIHITLLFPLRHGAPEAARFPAPISMAADGPVALPPNGDPSGEGA